MHYYFEESYGFEFFFNWNISTLKNVKKKKEIELIFVTM